MKLISKINKYKLGSSSKMQFVLFYPKTIQKNFGQLSILSKIWKWHKQQGEVGHLLCVTMTQCVQKSIFDYF